MWRCPTCKSKDHLEVTIETWASLIQPDSEPEAFQTDMDEAEMGHDQEWGENSVMVCTNPACKDQYETRIADEFDVGEED